MPKPAVAAAQADAERTSLERKRQEALLDLWRRNQTETGTSGSRSGTIRGNCSTSRKAELAQTRALVESRRAEFSERPMLKYRCAKPNNNARELK
jgi:hypothetical protein